MDDRAPAPSSLLRLPAAGRRSSSLFPSTARASAAAADPRASTISACASPFLPRGTPRAAAGCSFPPAAAGSAGPFGPAAAPPAAALASSFSPHSAAAAGAPAPPPAAAAAAAAAFSQAPPPPAPRLGAVAGVPSTVCRWTSYTVLLCFTFSGFYSLCCSSCNHVATLQLLQLGLNVVYGLAFLSLVWQADGLMKPETGLMPLDEHLPLLEERASIAASPHVRLPMKVVHRVAAAICDNKNTLSPSHVAAMGVCLSLFGTGLCFFPAGFVRTAWQAVNFAALYLLYLSFRYMARDFLSFQWDVLLLEGGLLTALAAPCASPTSPAAACISLLSLRLLAFKLFFCSGICKFASGDPKWSSLTALHYHYWTQPLPNGCSRFLHYSRWRRLQTLFVLLVEIGAPLLMLFGRSGRLCAFCAFLCLLLGIYISGNYGFFTPLAAVVCLSVLDDSFLWQTDASAAAAAAAPPAATLSSSSLLFAEFLIKRATTNIAAAVLAAYAFAIYALYCLTSVALMLRVWQRPALEAPALCARLYGELAPLHACNVYGLFATVTTSRLEVVIEELHTVETQTAPGLPPTLVDIWIELNFAFKPGDVNRQPAWLCFGHMPRVDWRLWFIPLRLGRLLHSAVRDGGPPAAFFAAGEALSQQQQVQQLQQQLRHLQQQHPPGRATAAAAAASVPADQIFPSWWLTLLSRIACRQPDIVRLLGPQKHLDLLRAPCPRGMRVSLFDYRLRPAMGAPLAAAFFPEGMPPLTLEQHKELEVELQQWEVGSWWMRRRHRVIDLLSLRPSCSSSSSSSLS